jgi:hypothetical protein
MNEAAGGWALKSLALITICAGDLYSHHCMVGVHRWKGGCIRHEAVLVLLICMSIRLVYQVH